MNREKEINRKYAEETALTPELFSVKQVCDACGLSRTMLIKLEEAGFLMPAQVNAETGYRWYDLFNVARLEQYQRLRVLGLSQKEVADVYSSDAGASAAVLEVMKARLQIMQRCIEELSLRIGQEVDDGFSILELPALTCYCAEGRFASARELEAFAFKLHTDAVKRGCRLLPTEPLFSLRDAEALRAGGDGADMAKVCIPIDPAFLRDRPTDGVEAIPGCRALSMLFRGNFRDPNALGNAHAALWAELDRRGLRAAGPLRTLGIVAPYVDVRADPGNFALRFAVPVKSFA